MLAVAVPPGRLERSRSERLGGVRTADAHGGHISAELGRVTAGGDQLTTALVGGAVLQDSGETEPAIVIFEADRITEVGAGVSVPKSATVIDVSGHVVMPGLIDAHAHLTLGEESESDAALTIAAAQRALSYLRLGVTAVRDVCGTRHIDIALRDAVASGITPGPTFRCSGKPIVITGGHAHPHGRVADGADEVRRAAREQLFAGADLLKLMCSGGVFEERESEEAVQFSEEEIRAAVQEAEDRGTTVAAHAHPAAAIKRALSAGVRSIEHGSFLDEEGADMMAAAGVPLVPTFAVYKTLSAHPAFPFLHDRAGHVFETKLKTFQLALERGVRWGIGSDFSSDYAPMDLYLREIEIFVDQVGRPLREVIHAATAGNAGLVGLEDTGAVRPGYVADLVVTAGNPTEDLGALRRVTTTVARGAVFRWSDDGSTLPASYRPRQR